MRRNIIEVWLATAESYAEALERKDEEIKKLKKALLEVRIAQTPGAPSCYDGAREALARKQLKAEGFDI